MRYQFYREHKYVSSALNDLERLIARTDFCELAAVEKVNRAFVALAEMLKGHAQYENERLHSLLKRKNSPVYMHAEEDHAAQDRQLEEIEEILHRIPLENDEKKIELGYHLYLTFRKFVADNLAHLHEEEMQILPELQRLYSDSELREVEMPTYREMTPDHMIHMIQVLFPHMNTYDKQAFLTDIRMIEPEKFQIVWANIQSLLDEKEKAAFSR